MKMADKEDATVEVIVQMTLKQFGFPKGASIREMCTRMDELGLRAMTIGEVAGMMTEKNITPMPNGQFLGELLSAIDHDPIIPGVFLNGKPVRQSDVEALEGCANEDDPAELVWVDRDNNLVKVTPGMRTRGLTQVRRADHEAFRDWP
jgi:hypothetical protein